jgi:hypothetical protein
MFGGALCRNALTALLLAIFFKRKIKPYFTLTLVIDISSHISTSPKEMQYDTCIFLYIQNLDCAILYDSSQGTSFCHGMTNFDWIQFSILDYVGKCSLIALQPYILNRNDCGIVTHRDTALK